MRDLSLLMDFYELTMANGYLVNNKHQKEAVFDVFFRSVPDDGGYAIFAGLEQVIDYLKDMKFDDEEIRYLRSKQIFSEDFLTYLSQFKFSCDVYSFEEGTPIFPNEPIMVIKGPIIECQLIETMVLLTINHQSLIATKASRIVHAAKGRAVLEFGARRAHGYDASIYGARAAYISGAIGTSNTYADYKYGIPAIGTMAHSFVQSYDTEYEAFEAYAKTYPDQAVLLVDTYHTLKSGIPNAIKVHEHVLKPMNKRLKGIRLDSGDLAYLSIEARRMLDEAGLHDVTITVSNSLDEFLIRDLLHQGAQIDAFGVGERLVTAKSESVFGGVFKLVAMEENGVLIPKIKLSENPTKTTLPGFKQVYRFYQDGMAKADVITLFDEVIDTTKPYELFDPIYPYKSQRIENYTIQALLKTIFVKGNLIYTSPSVKDIRDYKINALNCIWKETKRLENPQPFYVDYSRELYNLKQALIKKHQTL
jgi:nicotinate phosphoribosyltransferase